MPKMERKKHWESPQPITTTFSSQQSHQPLFIANDMSANLLIGHGEVEGCIPHINTFHC
jgi:hypothetical protein